MLLYALTRWPMVVEAAIKAGGDGDCLRVSFVEATRELDALRHAMLTADAETIERYLLPLLLERIASQQVPWRPGRYDCRPRNTKAKNKGHGRLQATSKLSKVKSLVPVRRRFGRGTTRLCRGLGLDRACA